MKKIGGCNDNCKYCVKTKIKNKNYYRCSNGVNIKMFRKYNCLLYENDDSIDHVYKMREKIMKDEFIL